MAEALKDFYLFNKLKIMNTFFRHKNIHKFILKSEGTISRIDYIIINGKLKTIRDTRVFRASEIDTDHYETKCV
jgi:hypothetical protein